MSEQLRQMVVDRVDDEYGLDVPQLFIVNISLPEEVEKALDTRSSMGVIGNMNTFQQYQMGKAMVAAAENPGGGTAAEGMGMGMGFAMANRMAQATGAGAGTAAPPPLPGTSPAIWHVALGGKTKGPYAIEKLAAAISNGKLKPTTNVWCQGMETWLPAGQIPQLASYFANSPPPPPPG
jgi:hypothetical protein